MRRAFGIAVVFLCGLVAGPARAELSVVGASPGACIGAQKLEARVVEWFRRQGVGVRTDIDAEVRLSALDAGGWSAEIQVATEPGGSLRRQGCGTDLEERTWCRGYYWDDDLGRAAARPGPYRIPL
jgi:hypothetical protein